jgi:hypothetical protein
MPMFTSMGLPQFALIVVILIAFIAYTQRQAFRVSGAQSMSRPSLSSVDRPALKLTGTATSGFPLCRERHGH